MQFYVTKSKICKPLRTYLIHYVYLIPKSRRIERNPEVDLVAILTDDTITPFGQSQVVGIAFTYAVCKSARGADRDKVSISEFGSSLDRFVSVSSKGWN